jgi:hypothetical protein
MRFKQFLNEATVERLSATALGDDWMEAVEQHCVQALREYREGRAIYKGWDTVDFNASQVQLLTPGKRKSQNTSNLYTQIFDSNPANSSYPKRSESFICATTYEIASSYGKTTVMLPFDSTPIGVCPTDDLWDVKLRFGGPNDYYLSINEVNDWLESVFTLSTDVDFNKFSTAISNATDAQLKRLKQELSFHTMEAITDERLNEVVERWKKLYTYEDQGFTLSHTHDIPGPGHEVWFSAPCIAVPKSQIHLLKAAS